MLNTTYSAISFHINSLDLEGGHDFLHFYNNTISDANYLFSLTGHISDSNFVVDSRRLTIVLETDEAIVDAGFDIDYEAGHSGIGNHTDNDLQVYPNPAKENVTLDCAEPIHSVEIRNAEGRIVYAGTPNNDRAEIRILDLWGEIPLFGKPVGAGEGQSDQHDQGKQFFQIMNNHLASDPFGGCFDSQYTIEKRLFKHSEPFCVLRQIRTKYAQEGFGF